MCQFTTNSNILLDSRPTHTSDVRREPLPHSWFPLGRAPTLATSCPLPTSPKRWPGLVNWETWAQVGPAWLSSALSSSQEPTAHRENGLLYYTKSDVFLSRGLHSFVSQVLRRPGPLRDRNTNANREDAKSKLLAK